MRNSDDLLIAAHLEQRRVERWLVPTVVPTLIKEQATRDALHGWHYCDQVNKQGRGVGRMLTRYKLSLLWLQQHLGVWPHLDQRALKGTGAGCWPSSQLAELQLSRQLSELQLSRETHQFTAKSRYDSREVV